MSLNREFDDILREKLGSAPQKATSPRQGHPPIHPPFPSWDFHFTGPRHNFVPQQIPKAYPKKVAQKASQVTKPTPIQHPYKAAEPCYKIGELGLDLATPLMILQGLGANLDPEKISLSQLKKEYRQLARHFHPDSNPSAGDSELFQQACQAYKELLKAIEDKARS